MQKICAVAGIFLIASCATESYHAPLRLPNKPNVPVVSNQALSCLSDSAYLSLVERETILNAYTNQVIKLVNKHNESSD